MRRARLAPRFPDMDSTDPPHVTVITKDAVALALTDPNADNLVPPLIELTFELVNLLRVSALVDFSPRDYFLEQSGRMNWWTLDRMH